MIDRFWQRWRWSLYCGAAVLLFFLVLAVGNDLWNYVGVSHMRPFFADIAAILAAGEAHRAGLDVYQPNPFDPVHRPHVYGPWWLVAGSLGLVTSDAWWLGALLGVVFVAVVLAMLAPKSWGESVMAFLLLVSPPIMLAIERANNDIVIFLLLALAAVLLLRSSRAMASVGAAMIILAAALKFYPVAAIAALGGRPARVKRLWGAAVACVLVLGFFLWQQRAGFERAFAIAPRPITVFAYGFELFGLAWRSPWLSHGWLIFGYGAGLAMVLGAIGPYWRQLWGALPVHGVRTAAAVAGGASWLLCYFANNNYPYRAVLLLLVVPCWFALAAESQDKIRMLGRRLTLLLLVVLWLSVPKLWWAEILLKRAEDMAMAAPWLAVVVALEQTLILAINVVLAICLCGWAWRRLRTDDPL